jgi:hypothetical protein
VDGRSSRRKDTFPSQISRAHVMCSEGFGKSVRRCRWVNQGEIVIRHLQDGIGALSEAKSGQGY